MIGWLDPAYYPLTHPTYVLNQDAHVPTLIGKGPKCPTAGNAGGSTLARPGDLSTANIATLASARVLHVDVVRQARCYRHYTLVTF